MHVWVFLPMGQGHKSAQKGRLDLSDFLGYNKRRLVHNRIDMCKIMYGNTMAKRRWRVLKVDWNLFMSVLEGIWKRQK